MSESNGYATRESLFAVPPARRFKDVECSLGKFRLRSLNDLEFCTYRSASVGKNGKVDTLATVTANARLVVLCCVDADGNCLFTSSDVPALQMLDAGQLAELADACVDHCALEQAEDDVKN